MGCPTRRVEVVKYLTIGLTSCTLVGVLASFCYSQTDWLPSPPFVVNCARQTDEAPIALAEAGEQREVYPERLVHLPDVRYRAAQAYGHGGGEGYRHWHGGSRPALGPQWESDLFASRRVAPRGYTFAIPGSIT